MTRGHIPMKDEAKKFMTKHKIFRKFVEKFSDRLQMVRAVRYNSKADTLNLLKPFCAALPLILKTLIE